MRLPSRRSRSVTRASSGPNGRRAEEKGPRMKTEYGFTLPRGFVDRHGNVHRDGTIRLATARDEIEPLRETTVRQNEAYLSVLLLARVVTRIGPVTDVTPELI